MKQPAKITLIILGILCGVVLLAASWIVYAVASSGEVSAVGGQWEAFRSSGGFIIEAGARHTILRRRRLLFPKDVSIIQNHRYLGGDCVLYTNFYKELYSACSDQPPALITSFGGNSILGDPIVLGKGRELRVADALHFARASREERIGGGWIAQREALPDPGMPPAIRIYRGSRGLWPAVRSSVVRYRYIGDDCLLLLGFLAELSVICGKGRLLSIAQPTNPADFDKPTIQIYSGPVEVEEIKRQALRCKKEDCFYSKP